MGDTEVPAFSMWKSFNDTIPIILNMEKSDGFLERFTNILRLPEFSEMFICCPKSGATASEHEKIISKYKSFTVWLLGRFFYMLGQKKLSGLHELLIATQKKILQSISLTQGQLYHELTLEYLEVLKQLNSFHRNECKGDIQLRAFVPERQDDLAESLDLSPLFVQVSSRQGFLSMQEVTLKLIEPVIVEKLMYRYTHPDVVEILENLLYILKHCNADLKMQVLQIYSAICCISEEYPENVVKYLRGMFIAYEQLVHRVLTQDLEVDFDRFQKVSCIILSRKREGVQELCEYVLTKKCDKTVTLAKELFEICVKGAGESFAVDTDEVDFLLLKRKIIINEISSNYEGVSTTWLCMYEKWQNKLRTESCSSSCCLNDLLSELQTLLNLTVDIFVYREGTVRFLKELEVFNQIVPHIVQHLRTCSTSLDYELFCTILTHLLYLGDECNNKLYFNLVVSWFVSEIFDTEICGGQNQNVKYIFGHLKRKTLSNPIKISTLLHYMQVSNSYVGFQSKFTDIVTTKFKELPELYVQAPEYLPQILAKCTNPEQMLIALVINPLKTGTEQTLVNITKFLPEMILVLTSTYKVKTIYSKGKLAYQFDRSEPCESRISNNTMRDLMRAIFAIINNGAEPVKENLILTLCILSKNVPMFEKVHLPKWMSLLEDTSEKVRAAMARNFSNIATKSKTKRDSNQDLFGLLKATVKKSLQHNYALQATTIDALESLIAVDNDFTSVQIMKLLLLYVMIPTSRHTYKAIRVFLELAKARGMTVEKMYSMHRRDLCKTIVDLCAINQALCNHTVAKSLENVSNLFGFDCSKVYVIEECRYLLPLFVGLVHKMPAVEVLIREISDLNEVELSDLLSAKYGYIYLHTVLMDDGEGARCLEYAERCAGMDGTVLRKRSFMIILNELLLNFHEKREQVLLALKRLAIEEVGNTSIQDFLQPRFLGVLQYFDLKLMAPNFPKEKVLLSLAGIFKFMGPKHITPLRFKITAMLRTALTLNHDNFLELNSDVWDVFVRSCDIEALGPQLATIFVSILPLVADNSAKINRIFRYLVVDNEIVLQDNIPDLFFVLEFEVDHLVHDAINKYLAPVQEKPFREHVQYFLKYLSYETIDVRIYALKYIRNLIQKNRQDLDEMILGYNGIDKVVVDLLEMLTVGCRENNTALQLACADCIGELGAVEPSHLPRRCNQQQTSFNFFVDEHTFIVSSLRELIRGIQSEKNTQNIDRFALAIQETLKSYNISPDPNSSNNNLWNEFSDSHQELMLPLLSSKYTMVQGIEIITASPIYGSNFGTNFQSWLYSWAVSLVCTLKSTKKNILQVYLLSMKGDHKTLMYFLPYLLLHALIEGDKQDIEKIHREFTAVLELKGRETLTEHILNVRPFRGENYTPPVVETTTTDGNKQYTKVIFVLLDFLDRWLREWLWDRGSAGRDDESYVKIKKFLSQFCKYELAKCNFECGEYPRALMHLEDYMAKNKTANNSEHLSLLAEIYYRLDEPDGVAGVAALRQGEPSLEQKILALEVSGKLSDAAACYERLSLPMNIRHVQGLIRCYLDLDNVNTALNFAKGEMNRQPEFTTWMLEAQAESLWRLGQYDDLDTLLKRRELRKSKSWAVQVGHSLLALKSGNRESFQTKLSDLKKAQVNLLSAASLEEGAYQHGYFYITRLHILSELEQVERAVHELLLRPNDSNVCQKIVSELKSEWDLRLKLVQQSVKLIEPILCLRRVAVEQAKNAVKNRAPDSVKHFDAILGESWLQSAEIARATEIHQQAYSYILKAEEYAPPTLFLEKAKLHWMREEHEQALVTLKLGLCTYIPEGTVITRTSPAAHLTINEKKICAQAKLLIASYNDSISNVDTDMNIQHYKEAMEMFREWEKSLICLAQYYDRIFQTYSEEEKDAKYSDMQIHMINFFGKSLQYGTTFVYQSMPRMLSIWFDYGTRLLKVPPNSQVKEERQNNLLKMTKLIDTFLERLPAFIFLTAFSQLISRICHPQREVYKLLKMIILKLILKYPQHTLWMMISVIKSGYSVRSKRCSEILMDPQLKTPHMLKFLNDFTKLAEKLIELCNKPVSDNVTTISINVFLRALPRLITKDDFSEIMIPTQNYRKLILPNSDLTAKDHNPFPNRYAHIVGIEDEMVILNSLQRPRRITFKGSDGKQYVQMLKPKDDLRKDFRLMEFNDIVNQMLSREPEARQRRLHIRLYSVAPLNEECGMIEWIHNLVGLRPVLMKLYNQRGLGMKGKELKEAAGKQTDSLELKRNTFLNRLLPRHPPVLGDWFKKTFPDVQGWLIARTAYIRTTSVISMVGYILGLGDRHGENINFDSTSGETVHVDFNCLFNKGEQFEWPERVPFRLTHNMVAAMGPLGVEGVFRKSCACVLRVLRTHTDTLMSIVTPFVYDPLVSWPRGASTSITTLNSERTNETALDDIRAIQSRLKGQVRTKTRSYSIPLSVEGQVNFLIAEAVSINNLCQMYIGWGGYL